MSSPNRRQPSRRQGDLLEALQAAPGQTMTHQQAGAALGIGPGTVAHIVIQLRRKGLLAWPADGHRSAPMQLTLAGRSWSRPEAMK